MTRTLIIGPKTLEKLATPINGCTHERRHLVVAGVNLYCQLCGTFLGVGEIANEESQNG